MPGGPDPRIKENEMKKLVSLLLVATALVLSACGPRPVARTIAVLEAEHSDRTIVIVRTRPAAARKCWKHGDHWHCRRR